MSSPIQETGDVVCTSVICVFTPADHDEAKAMVRTPEWERTEL